MKKQIKQKQKNKKFQKVRKIIIIIGFIITGVVFLHSSYKIITWGIDQDNIKKEIKKVEENITIEEFTPDENEEKELDKEENIPLYTADFNKLKKENSDVISFIKLNGTSISYPVVQTSDNNYYLNHSFSKNRNNAGWIFMDYRNDLSDKNIVLYGHGRYGNTMFGPLRSLLRENWFKNSNNHYISFITEKYTATYQIFSVYTSKRNSNHHIMVDFTNNYLFKLFVDEVIKKSIIDFKLNVESHDNIITLSTCRNDKEFVVVHAKLIKKHDK